MTSSGGSVEHSAPDGTPRAIVAGHGSFPAGLVHAVEQITGRGGVFLAVSNSGLSAPDIEDYLCAAASRHQILVFFTDLPGGSATLAVRRLMRNDPRIVLVTSTNLAVLLEFTFHANDDPREAAKVAAEKGRAALAVFGGA